MSKKGECIHETRWKEFFEIKESIIGLTVRFAGLEKSIGEIKENTQGLNGLRIKVDYHDWWYKLLLGGVALSLIGVLVSLLFKK